MKFKVLKPHVHDCIEYGKGDIRENVDSDMVVHLVKKGVIERFEATQVESNAPLLESPIVVETGSLEG